MRPSSFLFKVHELTYNDLSVILHRCTKSKSSKQAKQIHSILVTFPGFRETLSALQSKLVGVYACSGDLRYVQLLFDKMADPNVFVYNWMISAMAFHGHYEEAMGYFPLIWVSGKFPNGHTFSSVLKACVGLLDLDMGRGVHGMACKMGFDSEVLVCNALIDMYCKCRGMNDARRVFDGMPSRDDASWTSIISGYCHMGKVSESIVLFERMKLVGLQPNDFTWNALISGYAQSGDCDGALALLSRMTREGMGPDTVTWNSLVSGFARGGRAVEAVALFMDMLVSGLRPNTSTVTGLLPAYGLLKSIHKGREIHALIYRLGLETNVHVASALVDMYSKCASVRGAENVFEVTPIKHVTLWNAMIGCFGRHGLFDSSIQLFERMIKEGFQVNEVTVVCVLSACSHGGLVDKGLEIFWSMKEKYSITASEEHHACIVDLLSRAGKVEEAYEFLKEMEVEITESMVGAFFNGCKIHGRRDMAELLRRDLLEMDLKKPGCLVTLANTYAADEVWNKVHNMRKLLKDKNVNKKPGSSSVNHDGLIELGFLKMMNGAGSFAGTG